MGIGRLSVRWRINKRSLQNGPKSALYQRHENGISSANHALAPLGARALIRSKTACARALSILKTITVSSASLSSQEHSKLAD